jgi:Pentapeptide repeats (8 copies)
MSRRTPAFVAASPAVDLDFRVRSSKSELAAQVGDRADLLLEASSLCNKLRALVFAVPDGEMLLRTTTANLDMLLQTSIAEVNIVADGELDLLRSMSDSATVRNRSENFYGWSSLEDVRAGLGRLEFSDVESPAIAIASARRLALRRAGFRTFLDRSTSLLDRCERGLYSDVMVPRGERAAIQRLMNGIRGRLATTREYSLASLATFHNAGFAGLGLHRVDLSGFSLTGCNFTRTQVFDSALNGCDLRGARFDQARILRTAIRRANLHGARFADADLVTSDFTGSLMTSATLMKARVKLGQLDQVIWNDETRWPGEIVGSVIAASERLPEGTYLIHVGGPAGQAVPATLLK